MGWFDERKTRCVLETTRNAKQWSYVDFGMRTRERQQREHVYTYALCMSLVILPFISIELVLFATISWLS